MQGDDFRKWSRKAADWGADYRESLRERPVRARTQPGEIAAPIAPSAPEEAEPMEQIFADFEKTILPGMTHWQHPRFFAYFPGQRRAGLGGGRVSGFGHGRAVHAVADIAGRDRARDRSRSTGCARRSACPAGFSGVIQDSASSATLAAVLTMREKALGWQGNRAGLSAQPRLRVYASGAGSHLDRPRHLGGGHRRGQSRADPDRRTLALHGPGSARGGDLGGSRQRHAAGRHRRLRRRHQRRRHRRYRRRSPRSPASMDSICMSMPLGPARR